MFVGTIGTIGRVQGGGAPVPSSLAWVSPPPPNTTLSNSNKTINYTGIGYGAYGTIGQSSGVKRFSIRSTNTSSGNANNMWGVAIAGIDQNSAGSAGFTYIDASGLIYQGTSPVVSTGNVANNSLVEIEINAAGTQVSFYVNGSLRGSCGLDGAAPYYPRVFQNTSTAVTIDGNVDPAKPWS